MFKLIVYAALVSAFLVTVSCEDAASSSQTESCEDEDGENEKICPEYEVYSECPRVKCEYEYCPKSGNDPLQCPYGIVCDPPRCVCMDNRHRDRKTGKCILTQSCPPFKCSSNEEYKSCPPSCPSEKCSDYISNKTCGPPLGTRIGIVVPCQPQCRCKKGFYRNNENVCVEAKDCQPECPKHQVYSSCIQGECRALNCSQLGESIPCPRVDPKYCIKGCICAEGYVRDKKGKCIPKDTCPEGCGGDPNAQTGCSNYCGHSCSDYNKHNVACPLFCIVNGCSCKKGFVYDPNVKKCVRPEDCTQECPKHEVYSTCIQGQCGPKTCSQRGKPIACPKIDPKYCKKGCLCVEGYLRDENGKCIPQDKCPPECPKNEVFSACIQAECKALNCSQLGKSIACEDVDQKDCKKGCICVNGYVRDQNGKCIPQDTCPEGCGGDPNAQTGCSNYCGQSCSDYDKHNVACPRICNANGCSCKKGFVYDPNVKKCVRPEDCTQECPKHEVYSTCIQGQCGPKTCSQRGKPIACPKIDPKYCKKGCLCVEGYLRDENGKCIPQDKCPSGEGCGGDPNAVKTNCGSYCGNSCSDYNRTDVVCPAVCSKDGCVCKKNYVYDPNVKRCVLPKDCSLQCTGPNEEYNPCAPTCPPQNCTTVGVQFSCIEQPAPGDPRCKEGCRCKHGFYRDYHNVCVSKSDCLKCTKPNQEFDSCFQSCPPYGCKDIGKVFKCPRQPVPGDPECVKECRCKRDFYKNSKGECVSKSDCYKFYSKESGESDEDDDDTKEPKECPKNEVYSSCIQGECRAINCSQLGEPIACPRIDPKYCIKGCVCVEGYLRDKTGKCIPNDKCPNGCGGDPNAKPGCGTYCGNSCTDYNKTVACPEICLVNGCDCKDGHVYDRNIKKCVLPPQCTLQCTGQNEVYNSCPGFCPPQTCTSIGQHIFCPKQPTPGDPACQPACRCKSNFYRNAENVCVSKDDCLKCTKPNEVYDICAPSCPPNTCDSIGKIYHCPLQPAPGGECTAKCRCKKGFYRNTTGDCVSKDKCQACPENEVYNTCPAIKCDADYCPKSRNSRPNCPVGIVCDPPRCTCAFNRRRDPKTGKCILIQNCPPFPCKGPNEKYDACPPVCPGEKCSDYINNSTCPKYRIGIVVPCKPQCRCKKGFYRDDNDTCVSAKQCLADESNKKSSSNESLDESSEKEHDEGNYSNGDEKENSNHLIDNSKDDSEESNCKGGKSEESNKGLSSIEDDQSSETSENATVAKSKLLNGINEFSAKFFMAVLKKNPGKSLVMAPISILFAVAPLGPYSTGITHEQILKALNLDNNSEIRAAFPVLLDELLSQQKVELKLANKVYLNENNQVTERFIADNKNVFNAEAENVDFSQSQQAAAIINKWVEKKTNNYIQNIIPTEALDYRTLMVLVNAIFFLGDWRFKFDPRNTQPRDYSVDKQTVIKKETMYRKGNYNYAENSECDCKILEMPYENGNLSMTLWLPNSYDGMAEMAEKLANSSLADKVLSQLRQVPVKVYLPLMNITTSLDLKEPLTECNLGQMFKTDTDLKGISKNSKNLKVTDAVHKAFLEANEKGTKAAAATGIVVSTRSLPLPPPVVYEFNADHPFIFEVRFKGVAIFRCAYVQ